MPKNKNPDSVFKHKDFTGDCFKPKYASLICENCGKLFGEHIGLECYREILTSPAREAEKAEKAEKEDIEDIDKTLEERGSRYGTFSSHASITQSLKRAMQQGRNWDDLPEDMKESLEMIAHKIGRILNGDPYYKDSWVDIVGYAELINRELEENLTKD